MNIVRVFALIFLFISSLYSKVSIAIPNNAIKNEALVFSIEISGNDIVFPLIDNINGNAVDNISNSTSTSIINSTITKKIKKIYSFYPSSDFTFPSFKFIIDGEEVFTEEKKIKLLDAQKTKSSIFDFSIISEKNSLYVGQSTILTIKFKYKKNSQIVDLNFEKPIFDNFWFKSLNNRQYEEGEYQVHELYYLLFPQKSGNLKIDPLRIIAKYIDSSSNYSFFSNGVNQKKIYSNALDLQVKGLPTGINLIGDFNIKALVDKNTLDSNEAVSFKLVIEGMGNIDDIKDIKLTIPNTTIYANKPEIKTEFKDGKYEGVYTKVFSIVSDSSFVIPSINIKYFDENSKKIVHKKSKEFRINVNKNKEIKVQNKLEKLPLNVQKKEIVKVIEKSSIKDKIIYFSLGIIITLLILGLYFYVINSKKNKKLNEIPLVKKVKSSKTKKELLKVLSVYINLNKQLDELIYKIEKTDDVEALKKEIIKLLKQINLKAE